MKTSAKLHFFRMAVLAFSLLALSAASAGGEEQRLRSKGVTEVPGYVSHGVNVFNEEFLVDYSAVSPRVPWLMPSPAINEIGVLDLDAGAVDAKVITADTDPDLPVATIRSFADVFNPTGDYDPQIFNRSLDEIGSNFFGFTEVTERLKLVPFSEAIPGDIFLAAATRARPTVREWNAASGRIRYRCRGDGSAVAHVAVRDAMPNAVYTLWDIGTLNPLSEEEEGYPAPFGGLPNILLTDANGCGYKRVETPFCPGRPCAAEADSCTSYISAFLHWDQQVYGGAPAATFAGVPIGVIGGNHIVWPMSGTPLREPQNPFQGSNLRCPR